ncbi:UNVERIFIED_CONTAM: hypothetical protein Slati_4390600 [Sesamum latifolium]|uniref:Uncharacterized protein n=1 Tax=Sesamum latifolium TaxID=2727402 RepID=A0AAW2SP83_9LAMI
MAAMWPEMVEKVVIASSAVNMRPDDNDGLLKKANVEKIEDLLMPVSAEQMRKLLGLVVFRRPYMPDFFLNDLIDKLYSENRKEKLELLKGLSIGQYSQDHTLTIPPLSQEVLIVWGEHDQIFLLERAIELKTLVGGEKTRLQVIKNTSHVPQLERPAHFNTILHNFLHDLS